LAEAFALKNLKQSFVNLSGHARALANESSIELNQTCAGADLFPGIIGIEDAADTDDWQLAPGRSLDG
jgi:hypothetical protein